jgi:2-polyprenyl-3-methyl-5-hydroxy-6-metoxy-1,4-benzoquinol methylase
MTDQLACPACDGRLTRVIHRGLLFGADLRLPVWHCQPCGHRWLPTTADEQRQIEQIYSAVYAGFRHDEFYNRVVGKEIRQRLGPLAPPPGPLLDVGCGNGEFLAVATAQGYDCLGVDVSAAGVALAREKGLRAEAVNFLTHPFAGRFRIITMWDVMEHLQQPRAFVLRAGELLAEDGILVLKIPAFGALNFSVLQWFPARATVLLGAPDHVQYFTPASIARLLARSGFTEAGWFASQPFRTKPPTRSLTRRVSRQIQKTVGRLSGNSNLYLVASRQPLPAGLKNQIDFLRIEPLVP